MGRTGLPRLAFLRAQSVDVIALSRPVLEELEDVLNRSRLARFIDPMLRDDMLLRLQSEAAWFDPSVVVTDCRDAKDNKYLELVLASGADILVSSDDDLLVLSPWRGRRIVKPVEYLAM